ncbi:MAG: RHS repeat-associated core domain-containing protein [Fimbriimonadaceae bacterium]
MFASVQMRSTNFTYDDEGQLLSESRPGYATSYTYDGNGNRKTRTVNSVLEEYAYDSGDKPASVVSGGNARSFTYDLAGRMLTDSLGSRSFTWTAHSRLKSLTASTGSETYTYSAFGTRAKVGTRTFLRAGAGVTAGVLGDGNAVYTPGVSEKRGSVTTFSHSGLKDTGAQTDAPGSGDPSVAATREYDAFGWPTASSGAWSGPFGYAGQFSYQGSAPADPLGGLHLLGHRYYDPTLGRFLSRDPVGDGSNWYAYCENDPVGNADPSGLYRQGYDAVSDFMAGWGDALTPPGPIGLLIGPAPLTKRFREMFGYDGNVEYDDGWYGGGWWTGSAHDFLIGGKGALPKVARVGQLDDAASGAKAIIGETMERVLVTKHRMPWLDSFSVPWTGSWSVLKQNVRWVLKHCVKGHDFVDLGIDVNRATGRSWYYRAERALIWLFE